MAIVINPISPVAVSVLGFDLRWYALAYLAGFVIGGWILHSLIKKSDWKLSKKQFDDLLTGVVLGVILGGRLGYVLFYNLPFFIQNPLEIFMIWHGGMSFHGGLLGVLISVFLFSIKLQKQTANSKEQRVNEKNFNSQLSTLNSGFRILDLMAVAGPIGLFFGRIANFINMEVMGRITDKPWGVVFAGTDDLSPRHPSPLYEAATEGVLLFIIMFCLWRFTKLKDKPGALGAVFGMLYAIARMFCEIFRAPDIQIGFLTSWGLTMGQMLSGLMFLVAAVIFTVAMRKK